MAGHPSRRVLLGFDRASGCFGDYGETNAASRICRPTASKKAGVWPLGRCATCGPANCRFSRWHHTSGQRKKTQRCGPPHARYDQGPNTRRILDRRLGHGNFAMSAPDWHTTPGMGTHWAYWRGGGCAPPSASGGHSGAVRDQKDGQVFPGLLTSDLSRHASQHVSTLTCHFSHTVDA